MVGLHALAALIAAAPQPADPVAAAERLRTLDAGRRLAAVEELAAAGEAAVDPLLRVLADRFPELEQRAEELAGRLDDPDAAVREKATVELIDLGGRVEKPLRARLEKLGGEGRWRLTRVVGWYLLASRKEQERELGALQKAGACEALGRIGHKRAAPGIVAALDHADARVRLEAVEALGRLGAPEAVAPLAARLSDAPDKRLRSAAAVALDRIGSPEARAVLRARLEKESDVQVVRRILAALAHDPSAEAARRLILELRAADPMRREAAYGLLLERTGLRDVPYDPLAPGGASDEAAVGAFGRWWAQSFQRPWE